MKLKIMKEYKVPSDLQQWYSEQLRKLWEEMEKKLLERNIKPEDVRGFIDIRERT